MTLSPEQLQEIQKELERRQRLDALVNYKPGPTADCFLRSKAKRRLIYTNNQMGKTTAMQVDCAWTMRGIHPFRPHAGPIRGLVVVPQRRQASTIWGDRILKACKMPGPWEERPWIPDHEIADIKWAYSPAGKYPGRITLHNKCELFVALSGVANSWKSIEGEVFDVVWRDEADGNESLGEELDLRLVRAATKAEAALNGKGDPNAWWLGSLAWCYTPTKTNDEAETFRENCKNGVEGFEMFSPDPTVQEENPAVSVTVREGLRKSMSAEAFAIRGSGKAAAGDIAKIYAHRMKEQEHRIILREPYPTSPDDNVFIGYDPGFGSDPCGIMCGIIPRKAPRTLIIQAFYAMRRASRYEHINTMMEWLNGRTVAWMICDPNIQKTESTGKSFFIQFQEDMEDARMLLHAPPIKGRNRLADGIPLVEDYLCAKDEKQIYFDMSGYGVSEAVRQMEGYRWKIDPGGNIIKVPYTSKKVRDEAPDIIKYICSRYPYWIDYGIDPAADGAEIEPVQEMTPEQAKEARQMAESQALIDEWFADLRGPKVSSWGF